MSPAHKTSVTQLCEFQLAFRCLLLMRGFASSSNSGLCYLHSMVMPALCDVSGISCCCPRVWCLLPSTENCLSSGHLELVCWLCPMFVQLLSSISPLFYEMACSSSIDGPPPLVFTFLTTNAVFSGESWARVDFQSCSVFRQSQPVTYKLGGFKQKMLCLVLNAWN